MFYWKLNTFFQIYKDLENKFVDIDKWYDLDETKKLIVESSIIIKVNLGYFKQPRI